MAYNFRENIESSIQCAVNSEQKQDYPWATMLYKDVLQGNLSIAVTEHPSAQQAVEWWKSNDVKKYLLKFMENFNKVLGEINAKKHSCGIIGGRYDNGLVAHIAWLMDEYEIGETIFNSLHRPDVMDTKFWAEYSRAMQALIHKKPYQQCEFKKLVIIERYWKLYLDLIEAQTNGRDISGCVVAIQEGFVNVNRDKRVKSNWDLVEVSQLITVRWNFRLESFLKYITYKSAKI